MQSTALVTGLQHPTICLAVVGVAAPGKEEASMVMVHMTFAHTPLTPYRPTSESSDAQVHRPHPPNTQHEEEVCHWVIEFDAHALSYSKAYPLQCT